MIWASLPFGVKKGIVTFVELLHLGVVGAAWKRRIAYTDVECGRTVCDLVGWGADSIFDSCD